jgi:predicted secreted acid phosphatase
MLKNTAKIDKIEGLKEEDTIYQQMIKKKKKGKKNIIVMDLDGCIFNNLPRQEKIVNEFLKTKHSLPDIPENAKNEYKKYYNLFDAININLDKNKDLKAEFLIHFLGNEFLEHDTLIPGADKAISDLLSHGFEIHILTGRHHQNDSESMKEGTILSLKKYGIKVDGSRIKLFMKNDKDIKDIDFKLHYFKENVTNTEHNYIAVIDNEAKMLIETSKILKNANLIRFDSAQSQNIDYNGPIVDNWEIFKEKI